MYHTVPLLMKGNIFKSFGIIAFMQRLDQMELPEEQLIECRIQNFNLSILTAPVLPWIDEVYRELEEKGLHFRPKCFLADEWFVPVGIPCIGIPFYLAHPRLKGIEQKHMLEVEGGNYEEFMKLIRHEAGHAVSYAFGLFRKRKWQRLFGMASLDYPDTYRPRPFSKSFVQHLDNWYAQSHPDEDFAETFAIWLTPGIDWKKKYRGWKALEKLQYVDSLMLEIREKKPKHCPPFREKEYSGLQIKLKTYLQRKRKLYAEDYPDFYDTDLLRIFPPSQKGISAASFLTKKQSVLIRTISFWTKEKRYTISLLLQRLKKRCHDLKLRADQSDHLEREITAFLTSLIMNYTLTGKFKHSK